MWEALSSRAWVPKPYTPSGVVLGHLPIYPAAKSHGMQSLAIHLAQRKYFLPKILHDPKYLIPPKIWYYSIGRSCRTSGINRFIDFGAQ